MKLIITNENLGPKEDAGLNHDIMMMMLMMLIMMMMMHIGHNIVR